jgi:lipid-A-disaccharide synthase-like uncharacterized protein
MLYALIATAPESSAAASWAEQYFDVTEPWEMWWLLLGLLAQAVFLSRWIIQWVTSEVRRESVMPVLFWWCSLLGATMLLVYFIGRREPIGVLGQAFGWTVYSRNLYLIRVKRRAGRSDPQGPAD